MPIATLQQIKDFLGVPHADDDAFFTSVAEVVTAEIETAAGRSFSGVTEKVRRVTGGHLALVLPDLPASELTAVRDMTAGADLSLDDCELDTTAGLVFRTSGAPWAAGERRYRVTYKAGYATAPGDVLGVALALVAARYERRDLSQASASQAGLSASYGPAWSADVERTMNLYRDRPL